MENITQKDPPFTDQKRLRVEQDGAKAKLFSSDVLKSSFKGQSQGPDYPSVARPRKGKEMGSIQTTLDASINNDNDTERMSGNSSLSDHMSRSGVARCVACWSNRGQPEFEYALSTETGVPIYQLSRDELIETFPKILAVTDNRVEDRAPMRIPEVTSCSFTGSVYDSRRTAIAL